jgi:hypothetical protein
MILFAGVVHEDDSTGGSDRRMTGTGFLLPKFGN